MKGLFKSEPLLEVALEGFRGGYALPPRLEARYRLRVQKTIGQSGSNERYAKMLREGCAEGAQELFAGLWHAEFRSKMDAISQLPKTTAGKRFQDILTKGGKSATELTRLRGIAADLISSGAVTSESARAGLLPILLHNDFFEETFASHSKVFHSQLRKVLESSQTSPQMRAQIAASLQSGGCVLCSEDLSRWTAL